MDSRSVHAFIIGEHGDSELAVWSGANVSGISLDHFCELRGYYEHDKADEWLQREVRDSAYEIIRRKGATYYGVAMAVERIVRAIVRDEHSVLPVSNLLQGQYGIDGLCMSIPAVVGRNGVEDTLEIPLSPAEREALRDSAATLRGVVDSLELWKMRNGARRTKRAGLRFCPPGSGDHQPGYPLGVVGGPVVIGRAHGDLPGILKHSVAGGQLPVLGGGGFMHLHRLSVYQSGGAARRQSDGDAPVGHGGGLGLVAPYAVHPQPFTQGPDGGRCSRRPPTGGPSTGSGRDRGRDLSLQALVCRRPGDRPCR